MGEWCRSCAVEVWAYCLMPNHVHVIAVPMAARYIEQNPVRAGLAARPWEYPWSSARAHVAGRDDSLVTVAPPLLKLVDHWEGFLCMETSEEEVKRLRRSERTGRPLGDEPFTMAVERQLRRTLRRGKPGPKGSRAS